MPRRSAGWRFNGHELVADVLDGVKFKDGIRVTDDHKPRTRRSPPERSHAKSSIGHSLWV